MMLGFGLSKRAAELVSQLRTCDTSAIPLAGDFGYAVHVAPVMEAMEKAANALYRGEITKREAVVTNQEARRVIREINARITVAKQKSANVG